MTGNVLYYEASELWYQIRFRACCDVTIRWSWLEFAQFSGSKGSVGFRILFSNVLGRPWGWTLQFTSSQLGKHASGTEHMCFPSTSRTAPMCSVRLTASGSVFVFFFFCIVLFAPCISYSEGELIFILEVTLEQKEMLPEIRRPSVLTSSSFWLNSCERHRHFSPFHSGGRAPVLLSSCLLAYASPRSTIANSV